MSSYLVRRLLWVFPSLLGISLVTFLLMELAPTDRAIQAVSQGPGGVARAADMRDRADRLRRLQVSYGLVDPVTGERHSVWRRYWIWLGRAVRLDLAGKRDNREIFHQRILDALPITVLLNAVALLLALVIALPLAATAASRCGGLLDRLISAVSFVLQGTPEFVLATLVILLFSGLGSVVAPTAWSLDGETTLTRLGNLLSQLWMPAMTLAVGYGVLVYRFLRDSILRATRSGCVRALHGWGLSRARVRKSTLHLGLVPLATLLGSLLPTLITGTVVIESVFSVPGLGRLSWDAVRYHDYAMVMALTILVSVFTLLSLIVSDVLHKLIDPRVKLR